MNEMPKLSIIIATYNADQLIDQCLESIFSQSFNDFEVLISDGNSSDCTVDIIKKYSKKIAFWQSKQDGGIYDAWNQMLDKARGEYICFLGADDRFHNNMSLKNLFIFLKDNQYDLVTSKALLVGSHQEHVVGGPWSYKDLWRRMGVIHPGMLHHRTLFNRYGSFDSSLKIVGDYEFLLRLASDTSSSHYDEVLTNIGDGGISRTQFKKMLAEKRDVQINCARIGWLKANYNYLNKLWRAPVARFLKIPY
jgi:glycosyltransferase involved in cell wall biosynthesis